MQIDLLGLEVKDLEWYQMGIRAVIVFLLSIIFIRISGMRTFGTKSAFDVVVSITLGAVLSRCITGHYPFFSCLFAAAILVLLHRLIAYISYKSRIVNKLSEGDPIPLFKNGKRVTENLSKYNITEKELRQALHENNISDFKKVKYIWFESDGKISVVAKTDAE